MKIVTRMTCSIIPWSVIGPGLFNAPVPVRLSPICHTPTEN
jgi:hypothetical protein